MEFDLNKISNIYLKLTSIYNLHKDGVEYFLNLISDNDLSDLKYYIDELNFDLYYDYQLNIDINYDEIENKNKYFLEIIEKLFNCRSNTRYK